MEALLSRYKTLFHTKIFLTPRKHVFNVKLTVFSQSIYSSAVCCSFSWDSKFKLRVSMQIYYHLTINRATLYLTVNLSISSLKSKDLNHCLKQYLRNDQWNIHKLANHLLQCTTAWYPTTIIPITPLFETRRKSR